MDKIRTPLLPGRYYHIYNRGNDLVPLFAKANNYHYFLNKCEKYLDPSFEVLAYCLMTDHFHFIVRVREDPIKRKLVKENVISKRSEPFRRLFISYAQAFNKQEGRIGSLLTRPFRRKEITSEQYMQYLIFYIHYNPVEARIVKEMQHYPYSSFACFRGKKDPLVKSGSTLLFFEKDPDIFMEYHDSLARIKEKESENF